MKGWSPLERMHQVPTKPCPGRSSDYYWNHLDKEWVFVKDTDDMRWWMDGLFGHNTGPGEEPKEPCVQKMTLTGKEWKEKRRFLNQTGWLVL